MNRWCCNLVPAIMLHGQLKMSLLAYLVGSCKPCLAHSCTLKGAGPGGCLSSFAHPSVHLSCTWAVPFQDGCPALTPCREQWLPWQDKLSRGDSETTSGWLLGYGTRGHRFGSGREDESKFPLILTGHDFTHIILILANANSISHPLFIFNSI